mmetsp:Transcript_48965/g.158160  ORF Transcript_48965/g.158160 Transcript_48965/m.158160 type:complete len:232 (-) Transcript_48965:547-1242(-)
MRLTVLAHQQQGSVSQRKCDGAWTSTAPRPLALEHERPGGTDGDRCDQRVRPQSRVSQVRVPSDADFPVAVLVQPDTIEDAAARLLHVGDELLCPRFKSPGSDIASRAYLLMSLPEILAIPRHTPLRTHGFGDAAGLRERVGRILQGHLFQGLQQIVCAGCRQPLRVPQNLRLKGQPQPVGPTVVQQLGPKAFPKHGRLSRLRQATFGADLGLGARVKLREEKVLVPPCRI